jgi:hypothetical protein
MLYMSEYILVQLFYALARSGGVASVEDAYKPQMQARASFSASHTKIHPPTAFTNSTFTASAHLKVPTIVSAASVPSAPAAYKERAGRPFLEGHTYLLAIAWLKDQVNHPGSAALHSADRSWIESPSGASAGQFLLVFFAVCKCCAFH